VQFLLTYPLIGIAFAPLFLSIGIRRVDEHSIGATLGFHIIILPGVIALWPLLLYRWVQSYRVHT
jgi:hypothetical protein